MTSQYRCETCDFNGKGMMGDERCPYDTQKSNEDNCDLLYRYKRTTEEKELMELCGLTCHSDFQSEREKVLKLLDDLDVAFHKYEMDVCEYEFPSPPSHKSLMRRLDEARDEFRQEGKVEK